MIDSQVKEIQEIVDSIVQKKRLFLQVIIQTLKRSQKDNKYVEHTSIRRSKLKILKYNPNKYENQENKNTSNIKISPCLKSEDNHVFLAKKLQKMKLSDECSENQLYLIQQKIKNIQNNKLIEKIKNFHLTLSNDVSFLMRFSTKKEIHEILLYMKDKVKHELEGPQMNLEIQLIALETMNQKQVTKEHNNENMGSMFGSPRGESKHSRDSISTMMVSPTHSKNRSLIMEDEDYIMDCDDDKLDFQPIRLFIPQTHIWQHNCDSSTHILSTQLFRIKDQLMRLLKHLTVAACIYYGIEKFQEQLSHQQSIQHEQKEIQEFSNQKGNQALTNLISKSFQINGSKKLLPLLLESYSMKCYAGFNQSDKSQNNLMFYLGIVFLMNGDKILKSISRLITKFLKSK